MKLVEIEDLEVGDEIAIACQANFKYLRILRKPTLGTKKHWTTGNPLYKSVKCSTRRVERPFTYTSWKGTTVTRIEKIFEFTSDDHNFNHYVNLNCRQLILVKKANENV